MSFRLRLVGVLLSICALSGPLQAAAQTGSLHGSVVDPSGAVVPNAQVTAAAGPKTVETRSGGDGLFVFRALAPGSYTVSVSAKGFAPLTESGVTIAPGQVRELDLHLSIAVEQQQVTIEGQNEGVSLNPDQNSSSAVIRGSALDALSDDPNELENELQALAGPAAGPNGGQIYIDGFTGGQLPPKSSILEVRVNQNPFSAEFDRIGYGRVEIITKPGTQKLEGSIASLGTATPLNTANPLVAEQPPFYLSDNFGNVSGPLTKNAAYFLNVFTLMRQNNGMVDAVNPANTSENLLQAYPNPWTMVTVSPRVDFQLGKTNLLAVRDSFYRSAQSGSGVGTLNLPQQALTTDDLENTVQVSDTMLLSPSLINEVHFQWRRIRNRENSAFFTPAVTVQGAFTTGGNGTDVVQDHQDDFELQDYTTATAGAHALRFGVRLRAYRDANYSLSGANGAYTFSNVPNYLADKPSQYSATLVVNPLVRAIVFDAALFMQDDWRWKPNLMVGLGLRYEGQNWIHDHDDWAPRVALAWSPGRTGSAAAKTVLRAGYGWFYTRFNVPDSFSSLAGTPYVVQVLHDNLVNQRSYVVNNPAFFNPNSPEAASVVTSAASTIPSYHSIDPHFHAAVDMQGGIGVDRQITKSISGNITYLYTQGAHQYLSNNVTAPAFDAATYTITGPAPSLYNYQFQSNGVYKQSQLIATISTRLKNFTLNGNYTYNEAKSDTEGVTSFVSVAGDPGLDYGRAFFDVRHRVYLLGAYSGPHGIVIAPLFVAQSGTPYNLTTGYDFTGNNQFNARPAYGVCGAAGVVATQYGCLDADPVGKGEKMAPYGAGIGPANEMFFLRASKVIGVGPRVKSSENERSAVQSSSNVSSRGLSGGGAAIDLDASAPRRYNINFVATGINVFNQVNLGTPNGVLASPLFDQTQSLATGTFASPTSGNRSILFESIFSF